MQSQIHLIKTIGEKSNYKRYILFLPYVLLIVFIFLIQLALHLTMCSARELFRLLKQVLKSPLTFMATRQ